MFKRFVPRPLWIFARRTHGLIQRIQIWGAISRQLAGCSSADREVLSRSLRAGLRDALGDFDQWKDPELLSDARVTVHGIGEFNLRARTDDLYHVLPAREARVVETLKGRLGEGSTFVDAGANIGFFTVLAGRLVGQSGKVVAIEMMPDTAQRLRDHVQLNGLSNVEIIEAALSDIEGKEIVASVPEGKPGQASIVRDPEREQMRQTQVKTRTLDEILAGIPGRIALAKIDIEGAEAKALRGARHSLARIDAVIFEQLGQATEAADLLRSAGFKLSRLDGNNMIAERD